MEKIIEYLVTPEIKTNFWTRILRFFKLKEKRKEFKLRFNHDLFRKGDILHTSEGKKVKVL